MQQHPRGGRSIRILLGALAWLITSPVEAQTWQAAANNPGNDTYVDLPYGVAFVSVDVVEVPITAGLPEVKGIYAIGTDVLAANAPSKDNQLWYLPPGQLPVKLFPLPDHLSDTVIHPETGLSVPLIHTPTGALSHGAVVEPNVSEDGNRILFTYFHDVVDTFDGLSKLGADLYAMDLTDLIADPATDPADLPVQRLTFREVAAGEQTVADKNKSAMNLNYVNAAGYNFWGTVYMHGIEMRTIDGLKLVYASNERRLMNSNASVGSTNHNFNLHIADIKTDGSLGASRQFHYYTTTSAMSPTPLRNGLAFSYQAITADARNWHIHGSRSNGYWFPIFGYGHNQDLFHLGSLCVDTQGDAEGNPPGDYFVAVKYYNANNNGFGALWKVNLAEAGLNTHDNLTSWGYKPQQFNSRKISLGVIDSDKISTKKNGQYIGKMTTPRCGRPDELLFSYTPTSANGRQLDNEGNLDIYHAHIAFRPDFEDFDPTVPYDAATGAGMQIVVDDGTDQRTLAWPTVVGLSWFDRTGDAQQKFSGRFGRGSVVKAGTPFAQVGSARIDNTDRLPYDCRLVKFGSTLQPYNPKTVKSNQKDQIVWASEGLSYVQDPADVCKSLENGPVMGVTVNITSNRINHDTGNLDYESYRTGEGSPHRETVRQLGFYDVTGQSDTSFQAMIPSHTPFEFHLIDSNYGLRLADVRGWHSLYPREVRTDCGGCHQHDPGGTAYTFDNTAADSLGPMDMVTETQKVTYDSTCTPTVVVTPNPVEPTPEWRADIWPTFDQQCGSCHNSTVAPGGTPGLGALSYTGELSAYNALKADDFASPISGALSSPAFWAARGERTDGRDDSLYQPGQPDAGPVNYFFSTIHASNPGICGQGDVTLAQWVHDFGRWIDNHMPRDVDISSSALGAKFDRYHPAVDVAAIDATCKAKKLRVGYWDDSGSLANVETLVDGAQIHSTGTKLNGFHGLPNLTLTNNQIVKVIATDGAGNRQIYEKSVLQLKKECRSKVVLVEQIPPIPVP